MLLRWQQASLTVAQHNPLSRYCEVKAALQLRADHVSTPRLTRYRDQDPQSYTAETLFEGDETPLVYSSRSEQVRLESSDLLHPHLALAGIRFYYYYYYD